MLSQRKKKQGLTRKEKRKNNNKNKALDSDLESPNSNPVVDGSDGVNPESGRPESEKESGEEVGNGGDDVDGDDGETGEKQGPVRKIVSFIGDKIWGSVWG